MTERANSQTAHHGRLLTGGAFWAAMGLASVTGLASAEAADAASDRSAVVCRGRIVGADGEPIAGATVTAMGRYDRYSDLLIRHTAPGSIASQSDQRGRFDIEIASADHRFLHRDTFLLAVHNPGKRLEVIEVSRRQCRAGIPLEFRLENQDDLAVRVVDAAGKPISGVTLTPAGVGDLVVPFDVVDFGSPPSSDDGVTHLPSVSVGTTSMVYAQGDAIGKQCLRLRQGDGGNLQVVALPTTVESGRLVAAEENTEIGFRDVGLTLMASETEQDDSQYSWCDIEVAADGTFDRCRLSPGTLTITGRFPEEFPYALDGTTVHRFQRPEQGQPIEIELHRAAKVTGKLVDAESGKPIPHVAINHGAHDGRYTVTDTDGEFEFWDASGRISYYPKDASQRYVLPDATYQYPRRLPEDGRLELEPLQMQPIVDAQGLVVDEEGEPVGGAKIRCQYQIDGTDLDQFLYADSDGRFRFYGVPAGTGVTLTAKAGDRMSESAVNLQVSDRMQPRIAIEPRFVLRIRGEVVDQQGDPVAGARVEVRKHTASTDEEARWSRNAAVESFFGNEVVIRTGADGTFASPSTPDWDRHLSLSVSAPGYRTRNTYWQDAPKMGSQQRDLDFGRLTMHPAAKTTPRTIDVVDGSTGQPVGSAKVVFLGSRAGRTTGQTNEKGTVELVLHDGPQLMAVAKPGYRPVIRALSGTDSLDADIRLMPDDDAASRSERKPVRHTGRELKQAAAELLAHVKRPEDSDSLYRHRLYLEPLAFADFPDAADYLDERFGENEQDSKRMAALLANQEWLGRNAVDTLLPRLDVLGKAEWYLTQAEQEPNPRRREEWLGELLVIADGLTGDIQLYLVARIATVLLSVDERQVAEDLLQETWRNHPELEEILTSGQRVDKTGVARVFAPIHAVVDPEAAIKLIELGAPPNEIEGLKQKARVYLATYAPERWQAYSERHGIETIADHRLHRHRGELPLNELELGRVILRGMKPSPDKAAFLLQLAEDARDATDRQRVELCREALPLLYLDQPMHTSDHISVIAAKAAVMTAAWDRALAERFAFASIWLCEGETTILPFNLTASLARELALYDSELARTLIAPCFEDWSWLFGQRDWSVIFNHNRPLAAAATIDPAWAEALIQELFAEHLTDHPLRRLETINGVCQQLAELSLAQQSAESDSAE